MELKPILFLKVSIHIICINGNSLLVQWLRLGTFTAVGPGSIPGRGTKIPQAAWHGQKKETTKLFLRVFFQMIFTGKIT